jgi:triacylglycerol esterase/lipase EstA (alpha/beta hydrolase family)
MGGLIVKKVLYLINRLTQAFINAATTFHYPRLCANMKGVVFLGTPHRGAPLAKQLKRVIKATLNCKVAIQQLESYCKEVEDIFSKFNELEIARNTVSFYESMGMKVFGHVKSFKTWIDVRLLCQRVPLLWALSEVFH